MKVGVISDTHMTTLTQGHQLAKKLMTGPFADVACILHAGDHVNIDIEFCFSPCPWYAIRGNMDRHFHHLPEKRILHLNGRTIGMTHGWGGGKDLSDNIMGSFSDKMPDIIVFGHSHIPECRQIGSTLLFNPGSPTEPRSNRGPTVGILTIDKCINGEIICIS